MGLMATMLDNAGLEQCGDLASELLRELGKSKCTDGRRRIRGKQ